MITSRKTLWTTGGLLLLAILFFIGIRFYEKGYRLGLPTVIVAPGTIQIEVYDPTTQIYLDEKLLEGIPDGTQVLRLPVSAKVHELIISKDGFYPWQKVIEVGARETVSVSPFKIPSSTNGTVLPKTDKEYQPALAAIRSTTVPSESKPLSSSDSFMNIFVKDGALVAKVSDSKDPPQYFCESECAREHAVLALEAEVRGVAFLPGRNDVVLVAVGNSIFALELDTRGTQNFVPVYQGIRPSFGVGPGYLYIEDGGSVFIVSLYPGN